jgi:hypothetical protein
MIVDINVENERCSSAQIGIIRSRASYVACTGACRVEQIVHCVRIV